MSQMFWHKLLCWFIGSGWLEQRQVPCRQQCDSLRFNSSSVQAEIFWAQVAANLASTEQQIMAVFCINPLSYLFFLPGWSSQCFSDFPELLRCTWTQALTCEQGFSPSGTMRHSGSAETRTISLTRAGECHTPPPSSYCSHASFGECWSRNSNPSGLLVL